MDQVYGEVDFISNRSSTPYTEAVIHESQRLGNLFPVAIPHFTSNTAVVGDFIIPKGTHIVPFLAGIMLDDKTFPEPRRFAPERYIDEGNRFKAHPSVIPFGIGKRRCLGENLARTEIFYFFTSILKNFDIRLPEGAKNPSTEYKPGDFSSTILNFSGQGETFFWNMRIVCLVLKYFCSIYFQE